jgi:hypothetical protein
MAFSRLFISYLTRLARIVAFRAQAGAAAFSDSTAGVPAERGR